MRHTSALILICFGSLVKGASKYYDGENRPYEFGYNIEGNQHRHEKKDENGIITGEFGFITADGVYHVTAYATDENGNFKILFMKNIKIGLPGEPGSMPVPKELQPELPVRAPAKSPPSYPTITLNPSDTPSCSGCSIPKKETPKSDGTASPGRNLSPASSVVTRGRTSQGGANSIPVPSEQSSRKPSSSLSSSSVQSSANPNQGPSAKPSSSLSSSSSSVSASPNQGTPGFDENSKKDTESPALFRPLSKKIDGPNKQQPARPTSGSKQGVQPGSNNQNTKPIDLVSAQEKMSRSGGKLRPNSRDMNQLAESLSGILYKFNYTVGYHGHHEEGDIIGAKDGGYFFVGRDGSRRTVDYQANEFGYQPHIFQEDASPEDVPRPETEKEKGLKGYEFKWFNANQL